MSDKPHIKRIDGQWFAFGSVRCQGSYTRSWDGPDEACRKWYRMVYGLGCPAWALKPAPYGNVR